MNLVYMCVFIIQCACLGRITYLYIHTYITAKNYFVMSELLFQLLDFYKYMQKEREVKREERKEGGKFTDKIDLSSPLTPSSS